MKKNIKFFDGKKQDSKILGEIKYAINQVIEKSIFVDGPETKQFEEEWAVENGVKYCVFTSNGTSALRIAVKTLGFYGNGIVCPANSFFASASCVVTENYQYPVFVDTDESCNLNLSLLELSTNYKGVIAVNLYGNVLDHENLLRICREKESKLILDLAQSHYSKYRDKNPAEFCDIGCFSFYVTKTLGSYGEAGCLVTNHREYAEIAKSLRNHGRVKDGYSHYLNSGNMRGDEIQAAILRVKNKNKDYYINARLKMASRYKENLKNYSSILLKENENATRLVNYVFPIFVENRVSLKEFLLNSGIETLIHYPTPLPAQPVYEGKYNMDTFCNTVKQCNQTLSLPFYVGLKNDEIDYVCEKIIEFLDKN